MSEWKTIVVPLKHPITVEGTTYDRAVLREPDVETLEALDEIGMKEGVDPTVAQSRRAIVALTGLPDAVVRKMHMVDFNTVSGAVVPLMEGVGKG